MPGWLRGVSGVDPVGHFVTATRTLIAGTATTPQVLWAVAVAGATAPPRRSTRSRSSTRTSKRLHLVDNRPPVTVTTGQYPQSDRLRQRRTLWVTGYPQESEAIGHCGKETR